MQTGKSENMKDAVIIGGGVNGSMLARMLTKAGAKVVLLEKNADLAQKATGANSAIIHNGADPEDGTLKARFNLEGAKMYPDLAEEMGIDFIRCGSLVVAVDAQEQKKLDELEARAKSRDIPVVRLDAKTLHEMEPNLSDAVIDGLLQPTTAIVTPWMVAIAAMEEALLNGAELELNSEVTAIEQKKDAEGAAYFTVTTSDGREYEGRKVINAAGVHADEIAALMGSHPYTIRPKKGEYFVLSKYPKPLVSKIIYPVPGATGKGILVTPTVHENTLLGPNAVFIEDKEDVTCLGDLKDIQDGVAKIIKNVPYSRVIRRFAGNRPVGDRHDFVVEEDEKIPGLIHVACIESPGLSSSPAIAEYVAQTWFHDCSPVEN